MGAMTYSKFILYNVVGAIIWVVLLLGAGYTFGQVEVVKKNFSVVIFAIIFISILPGIIEFIRARRAGKAEKAAEKPAAN
jgi:membrane-associated protein